MKHLLSRLLAPSLVLASLVPLQAQDNSALVDFDLGAEGWSINGLSTITAVGGNPGAHIRYPDPVDTFGIAARNSSNSTFLGDYTAKGEVELSIDFKVDFISFFGSPVPRELVVILYDDNEFMGAPAAQVWFSLGVLEGNGMPWKKFATTVTDVLSDTLPEGWHGAGDEDPVTFEPILPAGRTWTNVLQGIDRIEFTTFVPGFFFGFTNFDLSVDNVSIQPLPAQTWSNLGGGTIGIAGQPTLEGTGSLVGGTLASVSLTNAAPNAPMLAWVSFGPTPFPALGGTVHAFPYTTQLFFFADVAGSFNGETTWPTGLMSGTEVWFQFLVQDLSTPHDITLSNGLLATTP